MLDLFGIRYEFLPAYSPDKNHIELCFAQIKSYLRRNCRIIRELRDLGLMDDAELLEECASKITPQRAKNYIRHCDYDFE
jgi:transposase